MKKILILASILSLIVIIGGWGSTGHRIVSSNAYLSYNAQMQEFNTWSTYLSEHASDADYRKNDDPDESPKHYIDIDQYYSFLFQGRIPQTLDSVVAMYGNSFVYGHGILPYATIATVQLLQQCFANHDMEAAKVAAADLGHYVGDGHQPLHITANYDGQNTGNDGIHSRYETSMVNAYQSQIIYSGDSIAVIPDITSYVFNYIYHNYTYLDSILQADTYAKSVAGSTNSSAYKQALWSKTGNLTINLMRDASHRLTELIYTAWVNAGSPSLTAFSVNEFGSNITGPLKSVTLDPGTNGIRILYTLTKESPVSISMTDVTGKTWIILQEKKETAGTHQMGYTPIFQANGLYFITLSTPNSRQTKKLVLVH